MNEITNIPTSVGQYSATTTYQPQDRVYNNGSIFASLSVQKGNEPSLTVNVDGTYDASDGWMLVAVSASAPPPSPVTPTIEERVEALESGKLAKPTATGTNGQHLALKDATTGETEWKDAEQPETITVDSEMSTTSTNPLQNKVISTFWYQLGAKIDQQILALQNLKASVDSETTSRIAGDTTLDSKVREQQTTINQNSSTIGSLQTQLLNLRAYVNQMIGTGVVHTKGEEFIDGIKSFLKALHLAGKSDGTISVKVLTFTTSRTIKYDYVGYDGTLAHPYKWGNYATGAASAFTDYEDVVAGNAIYSSSGRRLASNGTTSIETRSIATGDIVFSNIGNSKAGLLLQREDCFIAGSRSDGDIIVRGIDTPEEDNDAVNKSYVDGLISAIPRMKKEFVEELPNVGDADTLYFLLKANPTGTDYYDEYLYVNNGWELMGSFYGSPDLSNYYTKSEVNALNLGAVHKSGDETINGVKTFAKIVPVILDMVGRVIENVGTPVADTDAANKAYVDSKIGAGVSDYTTADIDTIWEEVF